MPAVCGGSYERSRCWRFLRSGFLWGNPVVRREPYRGLSLPRLWTVTSSARSVTPRSEPDPPIRDELLSAERLEEHAERLASQRTSASVPNAPALSARPRDPSPLRQRLPASATADDRRAVGRSHRLAHGTARESQAPGGAHRAGPGRPPGGGCAGQ